VVLEGDWLVTVGVAPSQADLMNGTGDLFAVTGRRSVPPRIVAVVMVLQHWLGLSDREEVAAFEFDARWKYACGGLDLDYPGFAHTVLLGAAEADL